MYRSLSVMLNCLYVLLCLLFFASFEKVKSNSIAFNDAYIEEHFESFFSHLEENKEKLFGNSLKFLADNSPAQPEVAVSAPKASAI